MSDARMGVHPPVSPGYYLTEDCGYAQITDTQATTNLATAASLTALAAAAATPLTIPDKAQSVLISVEGAGIRWTGDGQTPTASYGNPVAAGQAFAYAGTFSKLLIIRQAAGAIVNASFSR
jgi:hypothetical protein